MNLNETVRIPPHVLSRQVGDETVILDLQGGSYFGLNPVGARIWQLLVEQKSLQQVCDFVASEFEVSPETIEHDVVELVGRLAEQKLLSIE